MALFEKFFPTRKKADKKERNIQEHARPFRFSKEQVRVLLYRECEWRGRRLLYDSAAVEKVAVDSTLKTPQCSFKRFYHPKKENKNEKRQEKKTSGDKIVEISEGYGFQVWPEKENPLRRTPQWRRQESTTTSGGLDGLRGPFKALRLLVLVALLPALLIAVPLYLRYHVFSGQLYPVGMSDMRLIDKKVSTTWCQKQLLHSNATFNAFLVDSQPSLANKLVPVSMTRQLSLEDDMKEYWGFYLLQGSIVTVSTCVRWPGASLIMIRGHKHLQECAYIGDDSSEELEEILRANGGKLDEATLKKLMADSPTNKPGNMTRHSMGVLFRDPRPPALNLPVRANDSGEKDTPDPQVLKLILDQLRAKQDKAKVTRHPNHGKPGHIINVAQLTHRHRDTNVNEDEKQWLTFKDLEIKSNQSTMHLNKSEIRQQQKDIEIESQTERAISLNNKTTVVEIEETVQVTENLLDAVNETSAAPKENQTLPYTLDIQNQEQNILETIADEEEEEALSSSEILEDIFTKLTNLGTRGKSILSILNKRLAIEEKKELDSVSSEDLSDYKSEIVTVSSTNETMSSEEDVADRKIDTVKKLLIEIMADQKKSEKNKRKSKAKEDTATRKKRELYLKPALIKDLNEHDEKGNAAIEEDFEPDGIADHHFVLNETTANDMSRSEFWSSFSSSEEALLECEGLILNLPLTPHHQCDASVGSSGDHEEIARANTITYRVPTNGYYFFVFNSENEVQTNYIRVKFDMQKTIYDLTKGTVMECKNSTDKCSMPLAFFSGEKVILEVPVRDNDSLWNEEFVVISECEPRTSIYIVCVIAVPVLVIFMAFQ